MGLPGSVDFVFLSHKKGVDPTFADTAPRIEAMSGDALTELLKRKEQEFDTRFEKVSRGRERVWVELGSKN